MNSIVDARGFASQKKNPPTKSRPLNPSEENPEKSSPRIPKDLSRIGHLIGLDQFKLRNLNIFKRILTVNDRGIDKAERRKANDPEASQNNPLEIPQHLQESRNIDARWDPNKPFQTPQKNRSKKIPIERTVAPSGVVDVVDVV